MVAVAASSSCLWALVVWAEVAALAAVALAVALAAEASVAVAAAHAGNKCVMER
jgi:hypothetical protein